MQESVRYLKITRIQVPDSILMALIPGKCLLIYTNNFVVGQGHNLGGLPLTRQPGQKEGKAKMNVINAERNKLIHRVFACVRDNRKYEYIYTSPLA